MAVSYPPLRLSSCAVAENTKALVVEAKYFVRKKLVVNIMAHRLVRSWRKKIIAPFEAKYNARVSLVESLNGLHCSETDGLEKHPQFDVVRLGEMARSIDAADMFLPMSEELFRA